MCYKIASNVINNLKGSFFWIGFIMLLLNSKGYAQVLGNPIVDINFGAGTDEKGGALPADSGSTTYIYTNNSPNDGYYTIANTTSGMNQSWWTTSDHTGNPGGYMMIVNCNYDPGVFYKRTVTGLCGNTKYQFAAWIKNLNSGSTLPNVSFSIETSTGTVLSSGNTGNIPTGNTWIQYPFTFTLPDNIETFVIKMTNNAPGGAGNDLAIDDITVKPYVVPVTAVVTPSATAQTLCAGISQKITIDATTNLAAGYLQKLQQMIDGVWVDQSSAGTVSSYTISSPTNAGTYYYRIIPTIANNVNLSTCAISSNLLTLTVVASPNAEFSVADTTISSGDSAYFKDQSASTASAITNWSWNFGDGATSNLQNPLHHFAHSGVYPVSLTVTSALGCSTAISKNINIICATPVANFTVMADTICAGDSTYFRDQSASPTSAITQWSWDFGDGATSNLQNPSHKFALSGVYPVGLTVASAMGCSNTITKNINILYATPLANFTSIADTTCSEDSTYFKDQSESSISAITKWDWNFGDGATSNLQNPSHKFAHSGVYPVSLTVTSASGCSTTATKSININHYTPATNFTAVNAAGLCSDQEVVFTNQSTIDLGSITKIEWYFDYGNNPTVAETDTSPYYGKSYRHTYTKFYSPATINYQVRMLAYSNSSCVSEINKTVTLLATPKLTFTAPKQVCQNAGSIQLAAREVNGVSGSGRYSGTGVSSSGSFNPSIAGIGTFAIHYIFTSINGCADTISQNITVNAPPTVNAGSDMVVLEGGSANMKATASGNNLSYEWYPSTGLSSSNVLNPIVTPTTDINYTLTATDSMGCSASGQVMVSVSKTLVVPNTFTPNGDGINDTWNISLLATYPDVTIEVFNRYGSKVFYSIGYPIPWNGSYNGATLPVGTYYYIINQKNGRKILSGSVTIIK